MATLDLDLDLDLIPTLTLALAFSLDLFLDSTVNQGPGCMDAKHESTIVCSLGLPLRPL